MQIVDISSLIENILKLRLGTCAIKNNRIHYNLNDEYKILGFETYFQNENEAAINFYPVQNTETGENIPEYCLIAVNESFHQARIFNILSTESVKFYLEKIYLEYEKEVIKLTPIVTVFEDGVVVIKYKNELDNTDLNIKEYIDQCINLGLHPIDRAYVSPFLCKLLATSYNHTLRTPFYKRWKLLKDEKLHYKVVDKNIKVFRSESESLGLIELTRDTVSRDTLSTSTQSLLNLFAYLLSNPNSGIRYLLFGQRKIIENGTYWEGRPYIYLLDFKGECSTASENNKKFKNEFLSIIERFTSDFRKDRELVEDIRFFDDASIFFEKSACLKVLSKKAKEIDVPENYISSHEAIATYIEYVYMLHRALLQKIRQSHSVDEVSALRWRANELASPQEIAASGEVRIYSKNAWEKFGINDLKAQINEAILISYDEKQFKHEKKGNVVNLAFAILFGLLAIPSVGKDIIAPIWKTTNFYYPANAYENLYFFLVTCLILVIMAFLVLTSIRFFTKEK